MVKRLNPAKEYVVRITNLVYKRGRSNPLPPGLSNGDDEARGLLAKNKCFFGQACFPAGTLVTMADGSPKPVEKVISGDIVLSRDEFTGKTEGKKVIDTHSREGIWVRRFTFEGGTTLETTDVHPLYLEGKGFLPAVAVGIGTSIVTRAGPNIKVTNVESNVRQDKVYNLNVFDFPTYFVGSQQLWVHNAVCPKWLASLTSRIKDLRIMTEDLLYEIRVCGNVEHDIILPGGICRPDGLDIGNGLLLEAKHAGNLASSPFIPGSNCPGFLREKIRVDLIEQFTKYREVLEMQGTGLNGLKVITNDPRARDYIESIIDFVGIPQNKRFVTVVP